MPLTAFLQDNIGVLLLVFIIMSTGQTAWIGFIWYMVKGVRDGVVWTDTFTKYETGLNTRLDAMDDRMDRIERRQNGK